jgi:hypothetical protein
VCTKANKKDLKQKGLSYQMQTFQDASNPAERHHEINVYLTLKKC